MAQQREGKAVRDRVLRRVAGGSGRSVSSTIVVVALVAAVCAGIALGSGMAAGDGVVIERGGAAADTGSLEDAGRADAASGGDGTEGSDEDADAGELVVVDVAGAVASPAVVELDAGSRVADALDAAGGLAADADISSLNRAMRVTDGMKIYVPRIGEDDAPPSSSVSEGGAGDQDGAQPLVSINTATADELDTLPGVGPSTAAAIVEDREQNGPFSALEDLMRVSGIGEKKFENMKDRLCL